MMKRKTDFLLISERFWKTVNDVIDYAVMLVMVLIILVGIYRSVDASYVFNHAALRMNTAFIPQQLTEVSEEIVTDDLVGWLNIENTAINYPVMQGETNSEYLNKDCYGNYSVAGSIFLDYRNDAFNDDYSLIYGHHMTEGYMFGALDEFYDEDYYNTHTQGTLTVTDKKYHLEVFSLLECEADNKMVFDFSDIPFLTSELKTSSIRFTDPGRKKILALSTCRDAYSDLRTVLFLTMEEMTDD